MNVSWQFTTTDWIIIAVIIVIVVAFFYVRSLLKKSAAEEINRKFVREQWVKIEELLTFGKEMNYKIAIIEADKMLDFVLKSLNFPGEKMADRLKLATYKYPALRQVWWAHKVRNQVVHDAQYVLKFGETQKVMDLFKKALKELSAL